MRQLDNAAMKVKQLTHSQINKLTHSQIDTLTH